MKITDIKVNDLVKIVPLDDYIDYMIDNQEEADDLDIDYHDTEMNAICGNVVLIEDIDMSDHTWRCSENKYWYPIGIIEDVIRKTSDAEAAPGAAQDIKVEPINSDMSNLKPGDKVLIRPDLKGGKYYGADTFISEDMGKMLNKIATIKKIHNFKDTKSFGIEEALYNWTPEMCVGKVIEEESQPLQETDEKVAGAAVKFEDLREGMYVRLRDDLEVGEWYQGETFTKDMLKGEVVQIDVLNPRIRKFTIKQLYNSWDDMFDYTAGMVDSIVEKAVTKVPIVTNKSDDLIKTLNGIDTDKKEIDIFPPSDIIIKADTSDLFGIAKEVVNMLDNTGLDSLDKEKIIRMVKEYYR